MRSIMRAVARALAAIAQAVLVSVAVLVDGVVKMIQVAQRTMWGGQRNFEAPEVQNPQAATEVMSASLADDEWAALRASAVALYGNTEPHPSMLSQMPHGADTWLGQLSQDELYAVATTPAEQLRAFYEGYFEIPGLRKPAHLVARDQQVQALLAGHAARRQRERADALFIADPDDEEAQHRYAGV